MKDPTKHNNLQEYIDICLELARLSECPIVKERYYIKINKACELLKEIYNERI